MLSDMDYRICETQAELYEYAANQGFKFPEFSDAFLSSDFCKRAMDTIYSRFQLQYPEEILDFFHFNEKFDNNQMFEGQVAYWIGFTYRQMYFETGFDSKKLLEIYPFSLMLQMYPGMHTQDPEYVSEVLIESLKKKGIL